MDKDKYRIRALTFSDGTLIYCPERKVDWILFEYWTSVSKKMIDVISTYTIDVVHPTYQEAVADIEAYIESKKPKKKPKIMKLVVVNEEIIGYKS